MGACVAHGGPMCKNMSYLPSLALASAHIHARPLEELSPLLRMRTSLAECRGELSECGADSNAMYVLAVDAMLPFEGRESQRKGLGRVGWWNFCAKRHLCALTRRPRPPPARTQDSQQLQWHYHITTRTRSIKSPCRTAKTCTQCTAGLAGPRSVLRPRA